MGVSRTVAGIDGGRASSDSLCKLDWWWEGRPWSRHSRAVVPSKAKDRITESRLAILRT